MKTLKVVIKTTKSKRKFFTDRVTLTVEPTQIYVHTFPGFGSCVFQNTQSKPIYIYYELS